MKNMKKLAALLLAIVMMLAVSASALADGAALTNHDGTAPSPANEVVRILKEITVYNTQGSTVNEPTASYTYGITAVNTGHTVTDAANTTVTTLAGITTGVTMTSQTNSTAAATTTLTYTPDGTTPHQFSSSTTGTANTKWVDIDFSDVDFGRAGVFRYLITESNYTYTSNGVVEGNTGHTRYLDVYVKDGNQSAAENADKWDVYGYVLFTADENLTPSNEGDIEARTNAYKTTGFVTDKSATADENDKLADSYYTFNVTVEKDVVNDAYISTIAHQFPFKVQFTNATVTADVRPIIDYSGTATYPTISAADAIADYVFDGKDGADGSKIALADGATVSIIGIPVGTTVTIDEYNNVSGAYYTVTTTGGSTNESTGKNVADSTWASATTGWTTVTSVIAAKSSGNDMSSDSAFNTVKFINTLTEISPTGVVMRIAPYVLMLGAGVALFIVFAVKRRKNDEEEA